MGVFGDDDPGAAGAPPPELLAGAGGVTVQPGIYFDGARRLFRLCCKDSLYSFRVDDQRNLEHLYWGPALPADDDITYLTRAHVPAPFDPRGNASLAEKLGLEELGEIGAEYRNESWRVYTKEKNDMNVSTSVRLKSRRLENASWRLWHMERMTGGDLNRDLSEAVLETALGAVSRNGRDQSRILATPDDVAAAQRGGGGGGGDSSNVAANIAAAVTKTRLASSSSVPAVSRLAGLENITSPSAFLRDDAPSPLHPDRAVASAPMHRHPSPRPAVAAAPANAQPAPSLNMPASTLTPPSPHPTHGRPQGGGSYPTSFSSSPLFDARRGAPGTSPGTSSEFASRHDFGSGYALTDTSTRMAEASIDGNANGSWGGSARKSTEQHANFIAGLDLDGYKGSRQHFRAELKSRLQNNSSSDVQGTGRAALAPGSDAYGAAGTAPTSGHASAVSSSPGRPGFGGGEPLISPMQAGNASFMPTHVPFTENTAPGGPPRTAASSSPGGRAAGAHAPEARLKSPGPGIGLGMGKRKPSFAAFESHAFESHAVADSPSDAMFELNHVSSATNWENLDPEVVGKSSKLLEFSDCGTGDFREPSFKVRYESDGSTVAPLEYSKHRIFKGKTGMADYMPAVYVESQTEATTLVVEMVDRVTDLKVSLYFTVMHEYDVITRRTVVENDGDKPVCLQHLVSATVDFDAESRHYMTQLSGGWARERQVVTRKLDDGLTLVKSSRGASSHQFNPFVVISPDREPNETDGECFAFCLVFSGNFLATAEISEYRRLRVNMGINPETFTWQLEPASKGMAASTFYSPEVVMSYSNSGMGGMSRQMHRLFRERLIPAAWRYKIPPVLLNTWEACYFNVSHDVVMDIARKAVCGGIELLVLDDGWFGKRDNTNSGLGDWTANTNKLPKGLHGLAKDVNELGLKFGIWVEPEMVSMDSDLYRQHPDWCLHVPSRSRTTGRNQLVLDFSRSCVRQNIVEQLTNMLANANIEYVKWDMNRHLTEVFSQDWDPRRQGEISFRYVLGVYEVFARITQAFPNVLFESCSGGGGRFDAGMLFFSPQVWASDNTDALSRVHIQYGTSLAYPASTMGSHVSVVPNHQTLRSTSVKTRSLMAMSGTFGYELDPRIMTDTELAEVKSYVRLQKRIAPLVYEGDMYRLWSPFKCDSVAWMFVSRDKRRAVVIAVNVRRDVGRLEPRLRLQGLLPSAMYAIEELCPGTMARNGDTGAIDYEPRGVYQYGRVLHLSGQSLCRAGLPIKFMFDGDSVIFELTVPETRTR